MKRFLLILLATAAKTVPVAGQIDWTPYENNPVISPDFDIESQAIYRPTVVKWQGKYHMWYGKNWQSARWVAYATSDDGIDWGEEPADNAVLGPSATPGRFDELEATHGWVILDGDTLKMWYSGGGNQATGIGLAWSVDGSSWTKVPGSAAGNSVLDPALDGAGAVVITHPTVVKHDGVYHMWYVRAKSSLDSVIGYARSNDGKSWQVVDGGGSQGAVLDKGTGNDFDALALFFPAAVYNGDHFEMWYQGLGLDASFTVLPRVGCASSGDGILWQKTPSVPTEAGECFRSFAQPFVLLENGFYKMWYALSATGQNGDVVLYATSGEAGTSVERGELPSQLEALEIYPNPTASQTRALFSVERQGAFVLEIRDLLGQIVSRIDLGIRAAGRQEAIWNGTDLGGARVPSGAYIMSIANVSTGMRAATGIVQVVR